MKPASERNSIQNLTRTDWYYRVYLRSAAWKRTRADYMRRIGWLCERCHVRAAMIVHHLHYDRLYHEQPEDLFAVCRACHDQLHKVPVAANDNQLPLPLPLVSASRKQ
jgi:5-methylcytosine-specific restriction endonuclease McrA